MRNFIILVIKVIFRKYSKANLFQPKCLLYYLLFRLLHYTSLDENAQTHPYIGSLSILAAMRRGVTRVRGGQSRAALDCPPRTLVTPHPTAATTSLRRSSTYFFLSSVLLLVGSHNSSNFSILSSSLTPCLSLMPLRPLYSFKKCRCLLGILVTQWTHYHSFLEPLSPI